MITRPEPSGPNLPAYLWWVWYRKHGRSSLADFQPLPAQRGQSGHHRGSRGFYPTRKGGLGGRRQGPGRLLGRRLRHWHGGRLERRRPSGGRHRRGAEALKASWPELAGRLAPLANVKPFQFAVGGVCITPDWLHFDVVFHARSQVDPMKVEGMSPLLDKAGLLPDRPVPRARPARGALLPRSGGRHVLVHAGEHGQRGRPQRARSRPPTA